jgi:hypothetical protein
MAAVAWSEKCPFFENGDLDRAADSFTRAYALDGKDVFEGEDDKYLSFLSTRIEM